LQFQVPKLPTIEDTTGSEATLSPVLNLDYFLLSKFRKPKKNARQDESSHSHTPCNVVADIYLLNMLASSYSPHQSRRYRNTLTETRELLKDTRDYTSLVSSDGGEQRKRETGITCSLEQIYVLDLDRDVCKMEKKFTYMCVDCRER
jgi:hypothetical protein